MKTLSFLTILMLLVVSGFAQLRTRVEHDIKIELKNTTEEKELILNVTDDNCVLHLAIRAEISKGNLTVKVYDMDGKIQRQISLDSDNAEENFFQGKTQNTKNSRPEPEKSMGETRLELNNVNKGTLKILLLTKNTDGKVSILATKSLTKELTREINL